MGLGIDLATVGASDIVDFLMRLAFAIDPTFNDLQTLQRRTARVARCPNQEVRALAFALTASVADGAMAPTRRESSEVTH